MSQNPYQAPPETVEESEEDDWSQATELPKLLFGLQMIQWAWNCTAVVLGILILGPMLGSFHFTQWLAGGVTALCGLLVACSPFALTMAGNRFGNQKHAVMACIAGIASLGLAIAIWVFLDVQRSEIGLLQNGVFLAFTFLIGAACSIVQYQREFCSFVGFVDIGRRCKRLIWFIIAFWITGIVSLYGVQWMPRWLAPWLVVGCAFSGVFFLVEFGGLPGVIVKAAKRRQRMGNRLYEI